MLSSALLSMPFPCERSPKAQVLSRFVAQGVMWADKRTQLLTQKAVIPIPRLRMCVLLYIPPWSVAVWGSSWAPWPPYSLGNRRWFPVPAEENKLLEASSWRRSISYTSENLEDIFIFRFPHLFGSLHSVTWRISDLRGRPGVDFVIKLK